MGAFVFDPTLLDILRQGAAAPARPRARARPSPAKRALVVVVALEATLACVARRPQAALYAIAVAAALAICVGIAGAARKAVAALLPAAPPKKAFRGALLCLCLAEPLLSAKKPTPGALAAIALGVAGVALGPRQLKEVAAAATKTVLEKFSASPHKLRQGCRVLLLLLCVSERLAVIKRPASVLPAVVAGGALWAIGARRLQGAGAAAVKLGRRLPAAPSSRRLRQALVSLLLVNVLLLDAARMARLPWAVLLRAACAIAAAAAAYALRRPLAAALRAVAAAAAAAIGGVLTAPRAARTAPAEGWGVAAAAARVREVACASWARRMEGEVDGIDDASFPSGGCDICAAAARVPAALAGTAQRAALAATAAALCGLAAAQGAAAACGPLLACAAGAAVGAFQAAAASGALASAKRAVAIGIAAMASAAASALAAIYEVLRAAAGAWWTIVAKLCSGMAEQDSDMHTARGMRRGPAATGVLAEVYEALSGTAPPAASEAKARVARKGGKDGADPEEALLLSVALSIAKMRRVLFAAMA